MHTAKRNLILFSVVSLSAGFIGMGLDRLSPPPDPMQGLGALVWLTAPLLAAIILRWRGGDGWADFGLRPRFRDNGRWYLFALIIPVVVMGLLSVVGAGLGVLDLSALGGQAWSAVLGLIGLGFVGAMVKNIFEEFAWRGYLTPRFEAIGLHPFMNSLLTGFIWALWHLPYYLYFLDRATLDAHTSLSIPAFMGLALLTLPFHALAYGELRLLTGSVWPLWLMHNVENAIALPLVSEGFLKAEGLLAEIVFSPSSAGILHALVMGAIGLWLYRRRMAAAGKAKEAALGSSAS